MNSNERQRTIAHSATGIVQAYDKQTQPSTANSSERQYKMKILAFEDFKIFKFLRNFKILKILKVF